VFDAARLERNVRAFAEAARASRITTLFAMKSFPHPQVRALATEHLDGCDAASAEEVGDAAGRVLSIADPSGRAGVAAASWRGRLIVSCETVDQVRAAPAHAEIALRVSASLTGSDPAIGAVLDGSGHRRSRFGVEDREQLHAMVAAAAGRPVGLHVHHGPITATSAERFIATARAVLALADFAPRFLDLGGAWHGIADLPRALLDVRADIPAEIELIIEPGRAIVDGAGFARGTVVVARELADRPLRVLDLSRICHLRWSQVELVNQAPHPGEGRRALFVGPTCFEDDVIGEWSITPAELPAGARVVLRGVTGYAVAWNTSFGGVRAAEVVIGDATSLLG
jgi:diaminopimelate decarboxylase